MPHDHGHHSHDHSSHGKHAHGHACSDKCKHGDHKHDDEHPHSHDGPENHNYGGLKYLFSKVGVEPDGWLERHRSKAVLAAAAALAWVEYKTTGATSLTSTFSMITGAAIIAHDASEDLMEATGQLNETHNISTGVVGMGVGMAHTVSEGLLSANAQISGYEDVAIATTMGSNVSHIPLMAGMAGVIGALSIDKYYAYKMNAVFMGGVTSAFGYQVATGDFNPWLSAGTIAGGGTYLLWRVSAGQTCAVHGDGCSHPSHGPKNETDYISVPYWTGLAKKIKNANYGEAYTRLVERVENTGEKIANLSAPSQEEVSTKIKKIGKAVTHENVIKLGTSLGALGISAHVLGDNVIRLAEQGGISATAMGATVAALAFALPELILTGKAAAKKDGEMAWGAVTGCTVATVGIVGGYQGLNDFDIAPSLQWATTEGKVQMAAFAGSAAAIIAAVHPWTAKKLARADNFFADVTEKRFKGVSNWLKNDGHKLSKVAAAPMLAGALAFYFFNTQPNCHWHGNSEEPHCIGIIDTTNQTPLLFEP